MRETIKALLLLLPSVQYFKCSRLQPYLEVFAYFDFKFTGYVRKHMKIFRTPVNGMV